MGRSLARTLPRTGPVSSFSPVTPRLLAPAWLALAALVLPVSAVAAPAVTYVALGDSTATGVGASDGGGGYPRRLARRLGTSGLAVKLEVLGVSGATVADLRRDQLPRLLAMSSHPALVTLCIGINDVIQGRSQRDFARDLEVVADLVGRTQAAVVVATLPDLARSPSGKGAPPALARRLEAYNATIRTVAERHGFQVADVYAATRRPAALAGELFAADGFHPSAQGYELWVAAMWPAVERALGRRAQARRAAATPER